jgi:uncharacterized protein (TIGR00661 family)
VHICSLSANLRVSYKSKIYLSDEGFGHIVRQRAVIEELKSLAPDIDITLQTAVHLDTAKRSIPGIQFVERFNNIVWHKLQNGSPDVESIRKQYSTYVEDSRSFVKKEVEEAESYDFLISDFVYEAFEIAQNKGIPSFGVAHFTWDWFFSKLYPPIGSDIIYHMMKMADKATRLYFPPFTPTEITDFYRKKVKHVPLIIRSEIDHKVATKRDTFRVLIMDSGAGVLANSIERALSRMGEMTDITFYVAGKFRTELPNIERIPEGDLMVDYIADMDLVIGRAGFNTISECIGLRTPMLLLGEAMNPEMNENIITLKKQHLGSFVSLETFENELHSFLPEFLKHEYKFISQQMKDHAMETNGARVIAQDMLEHLS